MAEEIIDSMIVEVGADLKGFDRAMRSGEQQITKFATTASRSAKSVSQSTEMMNAKLVKFQNKVAEVMAKSTMSTKIAKNLDRINAPLASMTKRFLGVTNAMEEMAKQGNVASVAMRELAGTQYDMAQLKEQITLINAGLGRMNAVALVAGIAFAGLTIGLVKLSNAIDGRLIPAAQEFKAEWVEALRPTVAAFTTLAVKVVEAGTMIGRFGHALADTFPTISAMGGMFIYLTTATTLLLAPLAIGISRAGSYAVAFNRLWAAIRPFAIGFATVASTAMTVAGALVAVGASAYKLWTSSERLRESITGGFEKIREAAQPLVDAFGIIGDRFMSATSMMDSAWKPLGDLLADGIDLFVKGLTPAISVFSKAFKFGTEIVLNANGRLTSSLQATKDVYEDNKTAILTTAGVLGTIFGPALLISGTQAAIAGAKIAGVFVVSMLGAATQATATAFVMTGTFIVSLVRTSAQAIATGAAITGSLMASVVSYAASAWVAVGATTAQVTAWGSQRAAALASATATGVMTASQWALNAAMSANPIALVVAGFATLIASGIAVYKNWDTIREKAISVWGGIKDFVMGAVSAVANAYNSMVSVVGGKKINIATPSTSTSEPVAGSRGMRGIPAYANGGFVNGAQFAMVGEEGPEAIIPLSPSRRGRAMSLYMETGKQLGMPMFADGGFTKPVTPVSPSSGGSASGAPVVVQIQSGAMQVQIVQSEISESSIRGIVHEEFGVFVTRVEQRIANS